MNEQNRRTSQRPPRQHEEHDDGPRRPPPAGLALDPPIPTPTHEPEIPVDKLDQDALRIVYRLRHMGHKAYFVGGCVRDLLLDAVPKDFDLATDAHPGEVRAIFRNCRLIGRRFRLAHVYFRDGKVIEVATFRKNPTDLVEDTGEGSDLLITRDNVFGTAEEDAVRRDFTVNGLFYDPATGDVIDYVGGRADLEARRMATIGDPEVRMREDPVRALRAVRFAARLGLAIAPDTFEAMRRHAGELARCAPARVLEEIFKLLRCGGAARAFALLKAMGALPLILPALGAAHDRWDEAQRRNFIAHLGALDRLVKSGVEVSEAVLLGALLVHLGAPPPSPGGEDDLPEETAEGEEAPGLLASPAAEALLDELVRTSRLPRKVAERIRLALHAQSIFIAPRPKARRRGRGRGLAGQPYFTDALQLLRITVEATGAGVEVYHRWVAEAARQPPAPPEPSGRGPGRGDGGGDRGRRGTPARRGAHGRGPRSAPAIQEIQMPPAAPAAPSGPSGPARPTRPARSGRYAGQDEAVPAGGAGAITIVESGAFDEPVAGEGAGGSKRRRGGRRRRRRGGEGDGGPGGPGGSASGSPPSAPVVE
jgi:poly(A) polymerase